jgi:hypothetical protein
MTNRITHALALVTLVTGSSCSLIRRGRGATPPPVIAAPPTKPPAVSVENPQVPPPPKVEQSEAPKIGPPVATQIPAAKPPVKVPKPPKRPPRKPTPVRAQAPPPVEVPAAAATAANPGPPMLSPVLSPSQQEEFNRAIDQAVQQAESGLAAVASKSLNPTQRANVDRARSFVLQAQETRANDPVTAKSLADRAVVLAQSLVAELR